MSDIFKRPFRLVILEKAHSLRHVINVAHKCFDAYCRHVTLPPVGLERHRPNAPCQAAERPPSTRSTCPVMWLGASSNSQMPVATTSSAPRSEEHTSELQSLMRNAYAAFCL